MAVKRKIKRQVVNTGGEPVWTSKVAPERVDIIEALNWYNVERDEKDAAKYLKTSPAIAKGFMTLAWTKRMIEHGFTLPTAEAATYIDKTLDFQKASKSNLRITDISMDNVISIAQRVKDKSEAIIGEMEGLVDEYGIRGKYTDLNAYQWMVDNNVKPIHANRIAEYFGERALEPIAAAEGKAPMAEAYASYGKARLMNLIQTFVVIVKDARRLAHQTKTARKPRKKKPVSFEKRVAKLKFLTRDDKLKIQSMDPVRIIGANQLWIYNTKTRKLGVYNASDSSGLSVKGSCIKDFGSDSISKNLRKPEKTLPLVVDGGKIALRKVLDGINSKPIKLTGRINKDTLLIRVS